MNFLPIILLFLLGKNQNFNLKDLFSGDNLSTLLPLLNGNLDNLSGNNEIMQLLFKDNFEKLQPIMSLINNLKPKETKKETAPQKNMGLAPISNVANKEITYALNKYINQN